MICPVFNKILRKYSLSQAEEATKTWKLRPKFNLPNADEQLQKKTLHGFADFKKDGTRYADLSAQA